MNVIRQWLLFDRTDLCTGTSEYRFDEKRITERGRKTAQVLHDFWNFCMEVGPEHGAYPLRVPSGIRFEPEWPRILPPLFSLDEPWEQGVLGYVSALFDPSDKLYKVWYGCKVPKTAGPLTDACGEVVARDTLTLYAESKDLVTWNKPELGIVFCGGRNTNAVDHHFGEGSVFLDDEHPETGRIKAVNADSNDNPDLSPVERVNLFLYGSDDGFRFRRIPTDPLHYFFDTQNVVYYDKALGKYVAYLRGHYNGRAIQRAEADDIHHLPMPQILLFPDNEDPIDCDYYNNACTVYPYDPNYRIMLPSIYYHCGDELDIRMAFSRNGRQFQWVSREPIISHTDEAGGYFSASYACPHMLPVEGGVAVLLRSLAWLHNDGYFADLYDDFDVSDQGIRMAVWEKDRLAGIVADGIGEFWMQMKIPAGARLQVNVKTAGQGILRVGLENQRERVSLQRYSPEECDAIRGDAAWRDVTWHGKGEIPATAEGRETFVHFRLEHGKLFGVRLVSDTDAAEDQGGERIVSAHL